MPKTISRKKKVNSVKRVVKKVQSKSRKRSIKTKSKAYRKAYDLCVQKAIKTCNKRLEKKKEGVTAKKSRKPRKTKESVSKDETYREFLSKHMKDSSLKSLKVTERMKKIGEMWRRR